MATNDDLCTPIEAFREACKAARWDPDDAVDLDPCSNPGSVIPARARLYRDDAEHGLSGLWIPGYRPGFPGRPPRIWVNPPYSDPLPWCDRIVEAASRGCDVIALVKNDPTTRWAAVLRKRTHARVDLFRRVPFVGGAHRTGTFGSSILFYSDDEGIAWFARHYRVSKLGDGRIWYPT